MEEFFIGGILGLFVGFVGTMSLCCCTFSPVNINRMPIGSAIDHQLSGSWQVKGFSDEHYKEFNTPINALNYLEANDKMEPYALRGN